MHGKYNQSGFSDKEREAVEILLTYFKEVLPYYEKLKKSTALNEEEQQLFEDLKKQFLTLCPILELLKDKLSNSLYIRSVEVMFHVGEKAKSGDTEAITMFNELKELYAAGLKENLDHNQN